MALSTRTKESVRPINTGAKGTQHSTVRTSRSDGFCRYACTLIFPIRVVLQLRHSLRHGKKRSHQKLLQILSPKFRFIIDKTVYLILLILVFFINPLPQLCLITPFDVTNVTNAPVNTTLLGSDPFQRRVAAKGTGAWTGTETEAGRNSPPVSHCVSEYRRDQSYLEVVVVLWILAIAIETIERIRRKKTLAKRIHKQTSTSTTDIWDILDMMAIGFTWSAYIQSLQCSSLLALSLTCLFNCLVC